MPRTMVTYSIALALLLGCEAALGAHQALLLAVLVPLTGAFLLLDGRALRTTAR